MPVGSQYFSGPDSSGPKNIDCRYSGFLQEFEFPLKCDAAAQGICTGDDRNAKLIRGPNASQAFVQSSLHEQVTELRRTGGESLVTHRVLPITQRAAKPGSKSWVPMSA